MVSGETTLANDPYLDYCLWPYQSPAAGSGKLRSINLLEHSFSVAAESDEISRLTQEIRAGLGEFNTVWGVKKGVQGISWEYYFYDYERLERQNSISRLLDITRSYFLCKLAPEELRPYFMFSIDIDDRLARGQRDLTEINIYIGNVGSDVSSGICYSRTELGLRMDNLYYFFDAQRQMDEVVSKVACSAHLDLPGLDMDKILWPELKTCQTIVVANKKLCDGVYFSRIDVDQLVFFLKKMRYPKNLVAYVEENRDSLDHLLFDVGIDYVFIDGKIEIIKSAYYGVF